MRLRQSETNKIRRLNRSIGYLASFGFFQRVSDAIDGFVFAFLRYGGAARFPFSRLREKVAGASGRSSDCDRSAGRMRAALAASAVVERYRASFDWVCFCDFASIKKKIVKHWRSVFGFVWRRSMPPGPLRVRSTRSPAPVGRV